MRLLALVLMVFLVGATPSKNWTTVHAAVHGFSRSAADAAEEPKDVAQARREIANAVYAATDSLYERAALLAAGHAESLFAVRIGRDECKPWECDEGRARGYWQVHEPLCPEAFVLSPGPDRLAIEVGCALRFLRFQEPRCGTLKAAVSGFTGDCRPPDQAIRDRAFETAVDVLTQGGWPTAPKGWGAAGPVPRAVVKRAWIETKVFAPGETTQIDGFGVLVDWHWNDPSSKHTPKGWHRGLTFFRVQ